jgi:hypothetical protein
VPLGTLTMTIPAKEYHAHNGHGTLGSNGRKRCKDVQFAEGL